MAVTAPMTAEEDIEAFLRQNETKELLRFTTAGSVDDGKSTLIGRLLYDSKGVYEDQLASVEKASVNRNAGPIDFSLLTDGLRAEREQGITIDVAYRYFSTPRRKFIIADTPGHEQYTRNMATGASTAELAVVLVDARKGVLPQSRRHAYIAALLGIPRLVVAVNKMDLVDFDEQIFLSIRSDFQVFAAPLEIPHMDFIPISALDGDNVVGRSERTPWYSGPALLEYLEAVPATAARNLEQFRLPVQYVIRPNLDFRGYAGQVASGVLRPGDRVMVLPSGRTSRVKSIITYDGELREAFPPMSITVCLEDEIDISRGDMLISPDSMPHASRRFNAHVVWMNAEPLEPGRPYLLKHTTQQTSGTVRAVLETVDVNTLEKSPASVLHLNEIGRVAIETHKPLFFDPYRRNRFTGSFVLIDPVTNATIAAGMIEDTKRSTPADEAAKAAISALGSGSSRVTPAERYARAGHRPATLWITARKDAAYCLERMLFDRDCLVKVITDDFESPLVSELARFSNHGGFIAICSVSSNAPEETSRARDVVGADKFIEVDPTELSPRDEEAAVQLCRLLETRGIIRRDDRFAEGSGI